MKLKLRGYITSRKFFDERVPQSVQNLVIREFCKKINANYLLSATEYYMKNNHSILKKIIRDDLNKNINGIVAYSIFQLPDEYFSRKKILSEILKKNKIICFALENKIIKNLEDSENIQLIWEIKKKTIISNNFISKLKMYV